MALAFGHDALLKNSLHQNKGIPAVGEESNLSTLAGLYHAPVYSRALSEGSCLGLEIDGVKAEPFIETIRQLIIVDHGPVEISSDIQLPLVYGPVQFSKVDGHELRPERVLRVGYSVLGHVHGPAVV